MREERGRGVHPINGTVGGSRGREGKKKEEGELSHFLLLRRGRVSSKPKKRKEIVSVFSNAEGRKGKV